LLVLELSSPFGEIWVRAARRRSPAHDYGILKDLTRGVDLISDSLPFGRLSYGEPNAISNAIVYASFSAARTML